MAQFLREYELTIGTPGSSEALQLKELRVVFEITQDLLGFPNLAKIQVYNLSDASAGKIREDDEYTNVTLKAGYGEGNGSKTIFIGEIRNTKNLRDGVDKILEIYAGDGERSYTESYFSKAFKGGIPVQQIVESAVSSFSGLAKGKIEPVAGNTVSPTSFSDDSRVVMDQLAEEYGFNWSVLNGEISIIPKDSADTSFPAVSINRETGMIGSPTVTEIGADVRTQLNPELRPNRLIQINSDTADVTLGNLYFRKINRTLGDGIFVINKLVHVGDTRGPDWYTAITGRRV